jgi:hypothetical protein
MQRWLLAALATVCWYGLACADPNVPVAMYTGYGAETLDQLDGWTNRPAHEIMDYIFVADQPNNQGGWANFDGSAWYWACSVDQPRIRRMVYAIGFFPAGENATMAQAAAGAYDAHYANAASQLVACGYGDSIVRVAWEFNCCYPWGVQANASDSNYVQHYIAAFQRVVNQFRQYSPNFKFVWNPNGDYYQMPNYKDTFPGWWYVDIIGVDIYDHTCSGFTCDPVEYWSSRVQIMLDDLTTFNNNLTQNGWCCFPKPLALPEWAAGDSTVGDNPYFINKMANWVDTNWIAPAATSGYWSASGFVGYWNGGNGSGYNGDLVNYPKQRGAWAARFGGTSQ